MLGPTLLRASRSPRLRSRLEKNRLTRGVVDRFVAGETEESAMAAAARLHRAGRATTLDVLGEDVADLSGARKTRDQYVSLLYRLHEAGEAENSEVSLKLTALGQALPHDGTDVAYKHAREICAAAAAVNCRVTLDMEDHTTVDSTLAIGNELRREFPSTGNALQANLRRTQRDLEELASHEVRIRLVKGAYREPETVALQKKREVDEAYARAVETLMESRCYPMIATHDLSMLRAADEAASRRGRSPQDWETQMLFGVGLQTQEELTHAGRQVRVYIPFGTDWYGYFMRRLAERPANVAFFLRALVKN